MTEDSIKLSVDEGSGVYEKISKDDTYFLGDYTAVDSEKVKELDEKTKPAVEADIQKGKQGSLASVAVFPFFMMICYIGLILHFKKKGGYKPVEL